MVVENFCLFKFPADVDFLSLSCSYTFLLGGGELGGFSSGI